MTAEPPKPSARRPVELDAPKWMDRIILASRYVPIIGAGSALVFGAFLYLAMAMQIVTVLWDVVTTGTLPDPHELGLVAIELIDLMLIATATMLFGVGVYSLSLGHERRSDSALGVGSFHALKMTMMGLIATALGVNVLALAFEKGIGGQEFLAVATGTAAIIAALALYVWANRGDD